MTALVSSSVTTTSCVGGIGVRFANTTKVTRADRRARATAASPSVRGSQPGAARRSRQFGGRGLADVGHQLVSSQTGTRGTERLDARLGCPPIDVIMH